MRGVFTARFCSAVLLFGLSTAMFAQTGGQCTEAAVKRLAAQEDPAKTDDVYFYNALLDKPIVGRSELDKASQGRRKELSQQRANENPHRKFPTESSFQSRATWLTNTARQSWSSMK